MPKTVNPTDVYNHHKRSIRIQLYSDKTELTPQALENTLLINSSLIKVYTSHITVTVVGDIN